MTSILNLMRGHYRFVYLALFIVAVLGIKAFLEMPSSIYPPLAFPRVVVVGEVADRSPDQIVVQVTRPLEEAISNVARVKRIRSKTIRGSSELSIDFLENTDMIQALAGVQGKISAIQSSLPNDLNVTVERLTPGAFPVMNFNVSSNTLPLADLQDIVKYQIQPVLRRVSGVSRVLSTGGDTREIDIEVDPHQLAQGGLTPELITNTLQKNNHITAVGRTQASYQQPLILEDSLIQSTEAFENITVRAATGATVLLGNVAQVHQGIPLRTSLVSGPHGYCISLSILKQPNADILQVSRSIQAAFRQLRPHIARDIRIDPVYDQAELVDDAVNNVKEAIILGTVFIIIILFLFLRDWRTTLLAALTIPMTVLGTFWVMSLAGKDLNLMSLGGLAVAIGLVIDDAIVMVENIHRHQLLTPGRPFADILHTATCELAAPVFSSTLTTVVVFLPLGLLSGVAGQFFQALSFTLTTAVLISLLVALFILPMLAQQFLNALPSATQRHLGWQRHYGRYLAKCLSTPKRQVIGVILLVLAGAVVASRLPAGFMPDMDEGAYIIDYISPAGASLQATDVFARQIEYGLAHTPEVAGWSRRTGAEMGFFATEQNKGDILVRLKPKGQRRRSVFQIIEAQRAQFDKLMPGVSIEFMQVLQDQLNDLAGAPTPLEIKVYGEQPAVLTDMARKIEAGMAQIRGVVDLKLGTQIGSPEIHLQPNPVALAQAGLTPDDVQNQLNTAILGSVVSQYRYGDRYIDVRLRYPAVYRQDLATMPVFTANGVPIPLANLENVVHKIGPGEVQRENQQRLVSIEAAPQGRDLGSIQRDFARLISRFHFPTGYHAQIGGLYESQQQSFAQLVSVLCFSTLLVFAIMVFQFRSFIKPLLILTLIPIGMAGGLLTLGVTQTPLNVASLMGMILLTGLIVKNGIILVAYTDQLHADEHCSVREAVEQAANARLRPIIMTTLATMLGLLPLALGWGSGAELQKPLAIAVIGGLIFSTYMSLTFLPWLYLRFVHPRPVERRLL